MGFYSPDDMMSAILKALRRHKRPLSLDEISFFTRAPQSYVDDFLTTLVKANMVLKKDDSFILNKNKDQYTLKNILS
jgi:DNA-binding IclR family transcriptional regulator